LIEQPERPLHISQDDWDSVGVPELSDEEFAGALPLKVAQPDLFRAWKRGRGRPTINGQPKKHIGFRFGADVVDAVTATGKGYNARVEKILREAILKGTL
jgi:uncharacterized protein (DUF4415 family)